MRLCCFSFLLEFQRAAHEYHSIAQDQAKAEIAQGEARTAAQYHNVLTTEQAKAQQEYHVARQLDFALERAQRSSHSELQHQRQQLTEEAGGETKQKKPVAVTEEEHEDKKQGKTTISKLNCRGRPSCHLF